MHYARRDISTTRSLLAGCGVLLVASPIAYASYHLLHLFCESVQRAIYW